MIIRFSLPIATFVFATVCSSAPHLVDASDEQGGSNALSHQAETQITKYLAYQLMLANRNTIELSKAVLERDPDEKLQRFAHALRDSHWQFNERLGTLFPGVAAQLSEQTTTVNTSSRDELQQSSLATAFSELRLLAGKTARSRLELSQKAFEEVGDEDVFSAYLHLQISSHRQLLAELEPLQDFGVPEFQDVTSEMTRMIERHLITARQLQ